MKNSILTITSILALTQAFAQLSNDEKVVQSRKVTSRTLQSSNNSGFFSSNNFTKLNATNDGIAAEANINYSLQTWDLNLNVSTPVAGKSQRVKPLTIAGLTNNSSLSFGAQKIIWGKGFDWDPASFAMARKAIGKESIDPFKTSDLTEEEKAKFYELADIKWGTAFFYKATIGIDQQTFNYVLDHNTFTEEEASKTAIILTASFGILSEGGIFAASFVHTDGYQAEDPIRYYVPINNTAVLIEKNLSPSAPRHQNSEKLRIEFLSVGKPKIKNDKIRKSPIRINPNINVEFMQKHFSFEFPVYFLTSDKEKTNFNGGIYAGYVSDRNFTFNINKNNFGLGVFIGANFSKLFN